MGEGDMETCPGSSSTEGTGSIQAFPLPQPGLESFLPSAQGGAADSALPAGRKTHEDSSGGSEVTEGREVQDGHLRDPVEDARVD